MMTTKQIRSPLVPKKITIDSRDSSKKFFKNNYKIAHSLEINKHPCAFETSDIREKYLLKVGKRMKSLPKVYLKNDAEYRYYKDSLNLLIVKELKNTHALSLDIFENTPKPLNFCIHWLKSAKTLRFLDLSVSYVFSKECFTKQFEYFLKNLRRVKLEHLFVNFCIMHSCFLKLLLVYKALPFSLRSLGLAWERQFLEPIKVYDQMEFAAGLSYLTELKSLYLSTPFRLKSLSRLLSTICQPSKLLCFESNIMFDDGGANDGLFTLSKCLDNFSSLERVSLICRFYLSTLKHLEFLRDLPLKYLDLLLQLKDEGLLIPLEYSVANIQSLETLKITILGKSESSIIDSHFSLMTQISELKKLQSIKLEIASLNQAQKKIPGLLSAFSECIDKLPELRYIELDYKKVNFWNESTQFIASLKKKALQLRQLKIDFQNQSLKKNDLKAFIRVIEEAKSLGELSIKSFVFSEKEPLERLSRCLSNTVPLRSVCFEEMGGNLNVEAFDNMTRMILVKRGLEIFLSNLSWKLTSSKKCRQFQRINYNEILRRNPTLKRVSVPSDYRSPEPSSLESCKWDHNSYLA